MYTNPHIFMCGNGVYYNNTHACTIHSIQNYTNPHIHSIQTHSEKGYYYYNKTLEGAQYKVHCRRPVPPGVPVSGVCTMGCVGVGVGRCVWWVPWGACEWCVQWVTLCVGVGVGVGVLWWVCPPTLIPVLNSPPPPASPTTNTEAEVMDESLPEEILLDENNASKKHPFYMVGGLEPSPNDALLAWAEDTKGGELYTLRVMEIATKKELTTAIEV